MIIDYYKCGPRADAWKKEAQITDGHPQISKNNLLIRNDVYGMKYAQITRWQWGVNELLPLITDDKLE